MATFGLSYTLENSTGHVSTKWYWRSAGTSLWTTAMTSGMTYSVAEEADNTIYDFQIQNINNDDNPTCAIFQAIGFTDPDPDFSVSNNSISFEFAKPTDYITGYRATIALYSTPETVLQTIEIPSPGNTVTGTFTGLSVATNYTIALLVAANEFDYTFNYNKITTNLSSCYPPTNALALLTSGTHMTIMWTAPVILPVSGYIGSYRRKGVTTPYQTFITSGTTSGNTYSLNLEAPANYSGFIQSVCAGEDFSDESPFGINAYLPLHITIVTSGTTVIGIGTLTYPNPYDTLINGTLYYHVGSDPQQSFTGTATYPANSTNYQIINTNIPDGAIFDYYIINYMLPGFNNGGEIQQFDSVLTPQYFQIISELTSGATWNGNPATLPSFTLDNFIPTEQDTEGNITKGLLNFSWIYDSVYMNGISPYTFGTFRCIDIGDNSTMGEVTFSVNPIGGRTNSIMITKQSTAITPDNLFRLRFIWANGSVGGNSDFYLPEF